MRKSPQAYNAGQGVRVYGSEGIQCDSQAPRVTRGPIAGMARSFAPPARVGEVRRRIPMRPPRALHEARLRYRSKGLNRHEALANRQFRSIRLFAVRKKMGLLHGKKFKKFFTNRLRLRIVVNTILT